MASSSDPAPGSGLGVGGEPELLQLRQSLRLLENDSRALRSKYDFNCVFTKQLEAENFAMRERIEEAETKAARSEENLAEARSTLDAHKQWLAGMERAKASMEAELTTLREDAQSSQAMLELERKRNSKLTFDLEKLDSSLQSLQHVRNASSRASFREGLEEMRKNLGTLRFQRQLQAENARVGLIEAERNDAIALVKGLEATIAEQQRILNEVQREKLNASTVGAGERVRGETLGSSNDLTPQQRQGLAESHFLSTPASPGLHRGSLFDDLEEAEDEDEDGNTQQTPQQTPQQQAPSPAPVHVPAASVPVAVAPAIVITPAAPAPKPASTAAVSHSSSADELAEALADVRAQLLAAQAQLQSSRSSRVQVETSFSTAQTTIAELEQELATESQRSAELKAKLEANEAQATKELATLREQQAAAIRTLKEEHAKQSAAATAQLTEVTASNQAAVAKLQATHAAAIQALEQTQLEALTAAKAKIQQESEAQSTTKLAFLTKQHATAVAEQDAQHQKALAALQAQLAAAEASARDASSRAAAEIAKSDLAHKAHIAECELLWTEGLEKIRGELDVSRSARRTFESALMAAQQSARDHVCSVPATASDEIKILQASLTKAQTFGREQEALVTELRQSSMANNESLTMLLQQTNDVKAQTVRQQEQQTKAIAEAVADLTRTQAQLATLQKQHSDLSVEHASLQVSLRQSKSSCDDLTLQLTSLQSHEQSSRESASLQTEQLSKLVDQWQRECEKRKTAMEAAKKDASAKIDALHARIKELEDKIASHVCVSTGSHTVSGSGALRVSNPSPSPQASPASVSSEMSIGVYPGSASTPLAGGELKPSLLTVTSPSQGSSGAPAASPMVSSAFAKTGLAAGLVMEIHAYAQFISRAVGSDPDLKHLFPLDLAPPSADSGISSPLPVSASTSTTLVHNFAGCGLDLLRKMRDGLLIAKLINVVSPRTIDERVLNKRSTAGGVPGWRSIVENLNVCMTSAKTLGITMRVPQDSNNAASAAMEAAAEIDAEAEARGAGARASLGGDEKDASVPSASSPSANYVAVELGSAQLVLMSCDSTLENLEIVLDFLFQLLRARFTTSLFGPEARKIARLGPMVSLPMLTPDLKKAMTARTMSLAMPINDAPAAAAAAPKRSPRPGATLSKFATLSRALPANLSSNEHKKFVMNFTSSTLAEFGSTSELNCLTPEQLLLRWINFALMRQASAGAASSTAGSAIAGVHFVAHLSDLDVTTYALLLSQIDAWRLEKGLATASDALFDASAATSASVLAYLSTPAMHVNHFHTSSTLASKHERLNLLLLSLLFAQWSMMDDPVPASTPAAPTPMVVSTLSPSKVIAGAAPGQVRRVSMGHEAFAAAAGASSSSATSSGKVVTERAASTFVPPTGLEGLSEEEGESLLLKSYLNSCGIPHVHINNLFHDVRTGLILLRLVDWLMHGKNVIDWRTSVELTPSNKFKCISNLNYFLRVTRESLLIPFVNIGAVDIYSESNSKYVLAIIWQLLRFQTISKLKEIRGRMQREEDGAAAGHQHKEITDQSILEWANSKVKSRVHPLAQRFHSFHASSFQDPALRNSLFLLNLLDNLQEGAVDWAVVEVTEGVDPADVGQLLLRNASYTISIARKLGAELFALPQDIVSGNKKQLVLILASLMAIHYGLQDQAA